MAVPSLTLNNGVRIPQVGFGVFQIDPSDTTAIVLEALDAGYRHIDGAQGYRNEREVGDALLRSGLALDEVFVTSKLSNQWLTYDEARRAIDQTLRDLQGKLPDLFLVHWPLPTVRDYTVVWKAIEDAYVDGAFRAIGVSNFQPAHLARIAEVSDLVPAVNQIELHPYLTQAPLREHDRELGIVTEAWSPIAQGLVLKDPVIVDVAREVGRTAAQVVLRWHIQLGDVVFPKSSSRPRMDENLALFDFSLSDEQMERISGLNRDERTGSDPDTFRYKW